MKTSTSTSCTSQRATWKARWKAILVHAVEVTSQVMARLEIEERERTSSLLAAIVDSSDDAIISKNLEGIITSWNKSAERLFGYTAKEATGQPITLIIPRERWPEEREILDKIRRNSGSITSKPCGCAKTAPRLICH